MKLADTLSALKPMNRQRKKWLVRITVWLIAEILLNFLGLDNMADYSEFIFERTLAKGHLQGENNNFSHRLVRKLRRSLPTNYNWIKKGDRSSMVR